MAGKRKLPTALARRAAEKAEAAKDRGIAEARSKPGQVSKLRVEVPIDRLSVLRFALASADRPRK